MAIKEEHYCGIVLFNRNGDKGPWQAWRYMIYTDHDNPILVGYCRYVKWEDCPYSQKEMKAAFQANRNWYEDLDDKGRATG